MTSSRLADNDRWDWHDWAALGLLCLGALVALWWYWQRAPKPDSDTTMIIYRSFELDRALQYRLPYPRLAMDFNFTYGAPLLQYRPPLVHFVVAAFHWAGLGWITAAKVTATLELMLAGIGMYVYARWLFADRRAALVAGSAYLLAPYLLADIQERGALSETMALALLPWLFWASHRVLREDGGPWPWLAALLMALVVLAHNIAALLSLPVLLFYLVALAAKDRNWGRLSIVFVSLVTGLGLSAFYWLPALLERDAAQIETNMLSQPMSEWLASLGKLVQHQLAFDYWGPLRFHLALWQALVLIAALVYIVLYPTKLRFAMALLAIAAVGYTLMQLSASMPIWDALPLARFLQFPWRLLGMVAFCVALLAGYLTTWPKLSGTAGWLVTGVFLAILLYAGVARLGPQYNPYVFQISENEITLSELLNRGHSGLTLFSDFLPVGVSVPSEELPNPRSVAAVAQERMSQVPGITITRDRPSRLDLQVNAEEPFTLRFHRFFFPGWQVVAAGAPVPTAASGELGLVTADMPAGSYEAYISFNETPVRRLANVISIVSLALWAVTGIIRRPARPVIVGAGISALVVAGLFVARYGTGVPARQPTSSPANLGDEIRLLGYDLPAKAWRPGDDLPLTLYWLAQSAPSADYTIFMHIITPDDSAKVAQLDNTPTYGHGTTTRWEPGEIIPDGHQIHLDEGIAPGTYWLVVGMYRLDTMQNLTVVEGERVLPGDRIMLTPIEVVGE